MSLNASQVWFFGGIIAALLANLLAHSPEFTLVIFFCGLVGAICSACWPTK